MKRSFALMLTLFLLVPAFSLPAVASDFDIENGVLIGYYGRSATVTVPGGVTRIWNSAFSGNEYIRRVILPDSVTVIGAGAFKDCYYLSEINIPDSVTTIENSAFENCISLSGFTLGAGVTSIGPRAFELCVELDAMNIPKNVSSIGDSAFSGCIKLHDFAVDEENAAFAEFDGVLYSKDGRTLVAYPQAREGGYSLQPGTTVIESGAFAYAVNLTKLANTRDVEIVADRAFYRCVALRSISFPKASIVGHYSFYGCYALKTANLGSASIGESAFADSSALQTVIVADGARSIGDRAFGVCPELTNIVLPSSIVFIGSNAFSGSPKVRVLCEPESTALRYARDIARVPAGPLPKPSGWAVENMSAGERFAVPGLLTGYQTETTRYEFVMAAVHFVEEYYEKSVDELVKERELTLDSFSDTDDADILAANALGIAAGSGGMFRPGDLLTREQAATLVNNILTNVLELNTGGSPAASYGDAESIASWASNAVNVVTARDIMSGDGVNFNPQASLTSEMCIVVFLNLWNSVK
ncbi:MAG: leucine-rich repeat protein [Oscillospiraceae bacterium]|nr:leucine-rich repeat protein [Oscillospiraceae bacterium]